MGLLIACAILACMVTLLCVWIVVSRLKHREEVDRLETEIRILQNNLRSESKHKRRTMWD